MSRYANFVLGYYMVMAAQLIMVSIFVANKLGEPTLYIPFTFWTTTAPLVGGIVLEFVTAIMVAFIGGGQ